MGASCGAPFFVFADPVPMMVAVRKKLAIGSHLAISPYLVISQQFVVIC